MTEKTEPDFNINLDEILNAMGGKPTPNVDQMAEFGTAVARGVVFATSQWLMITAARRTDGKLRKGLLVLVTANLVSVSTLATQKLIDDRRAKLEKQLKRS